MSVIEKSVVDGIGLADKGIMKMLITDHLDWMDEYNHLLILQEKINAYIGFCESEQYKDVYAEEEIEHVVFEVHFLYTPTQNAYKFLQQIPSQINNLDVSVECCVAEEKTDK